MLTLYGYEQNPRTRICRIVAEAENIALNHYEVIPRRQINSAAYLQRFPLSKGKIPGLAGPGIEITETVAIVTYLAKLSNRSKLFGDDGSLEQEARVVSWMSWANQELLPTLALWFLPLIPNLSLPAPYSAPAIEAGKAASLAMLDALETTLSENPHHKGAAHLVGGGMTLADIFVAVYVTRGLQWVLGTEWRRDHPAVMRLVELVIGWAPVKGVIAEFVMIGEETPNVDPKLRVELGGGGMGGGRG